MTEHHAQLKPEKSPARKAMSLFGAAILVRKTRRAVKDGTLRAMCESTYGAKYVQKNFCPGCQYEAVCKRQRGKVV